MLAWMATLPSAVDEDWRILLRLLPDGWEQQALLSGALERWRGFSDAGNLLRTLLLHVGKGYSLRETAERARLAGLAEVSDVALLKRLRKAERWWHWLCVGLATEGGWAVRADAHGWRARAVDGSVIHEPGRGGLWRLHYSLEIPSLLCDFVEVTPTKGRGTGEVLNRFPVERGDLVLADRAYCKPSGVEWFHRRGAALIVRLNTGSFPLLSPEGQAFALPERLASIAEPSAVQDWEVRVAGSKQTLAGRLCVIGKSAQSTERERWRIRNKSQRGGGEVKPETWEYAAWVMVFTTLPREQFTGAEVLEWYRVRWQIELVFKRLKSLAQLGHLPKHDPQSARAWLYGKLLTALLCQKLNRFGCAISPWGYPGA